MLAYETQFPTPVWRTYFIVRVLGLPSDLLYFYVLFQGYFIPFTIILVLIVFDNIDEEKRLIISWKNTGGIRNQIESCIFIWKP